MSWEQPRNQRTGYRGGEGHWWELRSDCGARQAVQRALGRTLCCTRSHGEPLNRGGPWYDDALHDYSPAMTTLVFCELRLEGRAGAGDTKGTKGQERDLGLYHEVSGDPWRILE